MEGLAEVFSGSGHVAEMEYPVGQDVYGVSEVLAHQSVARLTERDAETRRINDADPLLYRVKAREDPQNSAELFKRRVIRGEIIKIM